MPASTVRPYPSPVPTSSSKDRQKRARNPRLSGPPRPSYRVLIGRRTLRIRQEAVPLHTAPPSPLYAPPPSPAITRKSKTAVGPPRKRPRPRRPQHQTSPSWLAKEAPTAHMPPERCARIPNAAARHGAFATAMSSRSAIDSVAGFSNDVTNPWYSLARFRTVGPAHDSTARAAR